MKEKLKEWVQNVIVKLEKSRLLHCIRSSLVTLIPILLVGSFSLMFRSLPLEGYQQFIMTFCGGALYKFLTVIYTATFGFLSIYMTISVSSCYVAQIADYKEHLLGAVFSSMISFIILSGAITGDTITVEYFGVTGMITAIVSGVLSSWLYDVIHHRCKKITRLFTEGDDEAFRTAIHSFLPIAMVILIMTGFNAFLVFLSGGQNLQELFVNSFGHLFNKMGRNIWSALLFELLTQLMWFFGIHGNNVMEQVSQDLFVPAIEINQQLIAAGEQATEIFSKSFFDVFVIMGGSGTAMCLLIALFIFGKRKSSKRLSKMAAIPVFFNISEILAFGLPVIFNPVFLIPFLLTPIVLLLISTAAVEIGIVPVTINNVEWTTPIIWSGYLATGSIRGSLLQIFNLFVGVMIYRPFIRMSEKEMLRDARKKMNGLVQLLKEMEEARQEVQVLGLKDSCGAVARSLADELETKLLENLPDLYYQPQYDNTGKCVGVEALLRWKHDLYGFIYPPLIVKIAEETGKLTELEKQVFRSVIRDAERLHRVLGEDGKISVNVSGITIQQDEFETFLGELVKKYPKDCRGIFIEITEQAAISINEKLIERLTRIKELGYGLAIDDFSMGSTSIKYLQTNLFALVKLDGSMTRAIVDNERTKEIVSSIAKLSKDLGIKVLAEYVETEEQRQILENNQCTLYQGYLYSPAITLEELEQKEHRDDQD